MEEPDGWTDYDEKVSFGVRGRIGAGRSADPTLDTQSNEPVSVMEFESKIERA